jgi:hypothetical protein
MGRLTRRLLASWPAPRYKTESVDVFDHEAYVSGRWLPCRIISQQRRRLCVMVPSLTLKGQVKPSPVGGIVIVRRASQVRPRVGRGRGVAHARGTQRHSA